MQKLMKDFEDWLTQCIYQWQSTKKDLSSTKMSLLLAHSIFMLHLVCGSTWYSTKLIYTKFIPLKPLNLKIFPLLGRKILWFSGYNLCWSVCVILILIVNYFGPLLLVKRYVKKKVKHFCLSVYVKIWSKLLSKRNLRKTVEVSSDDVVKT